MIGVKIHKSKSGAVTWHLVNIAGQTTSTHVKLSSRNYFLIPKLFKWGLLQVHQILYSIYVCDSIQGLVPHIMFCWLRLSGLKFKCFEKATMIKGNISLSFEVYCWNLEGRLCQILVAFLENLKNFSFQGSMLYTVPIKNNTTL